MNEIVQGIVAGALLLIAFFAELTYFEVRDIKRWFRDGNQ